MEIDIRTGATSIVDAIIYADVKDERDGYKLRLDSEMTYIESSDGTSIFIDSKQDAENLIKALQKAIELDNWSE